MVYIASGRASGADREAAVSARMAHAGGTVEALREVGAVSPAEASEWFSRLMQAAQGDGVPPESGARPSVDDSPVPAFSGENFRRLSPGPLEERTDHSLAFRALTLEDYGEECVVQFVVRHRPEPGDLTGTQSARHRSPPTFDQIARSIRERISLLDDHGTKYRRADLTAFADGLTVHARQHFVPGPPPAARRLTFTAGHVTFVFETSDDRR